MTSTETAILKTQIKTLVACLGEQYGLHIEQSTIDAMLKAEGKGKFTQPGEIITEAPLKFSIERIDIILDVLKTDPAKKTVSVKTCIVGAVSFGTMTVKVCVLEIKNNGNITIK